MSEPVGRPLKYKTPELLQQGIDAYFKSKRKTLDSGAEVFRPTMSGLAIALGMDRTTLINYSHRDEFFNTVKDAKAIVEEALEDNLYNNSVTGTIFNLKNNFGWVDKYENDNNQTVSVIEIRKDFGED
jgi:hypothetical protein